MLKILMSLAGRVMKTDLGFPSHPNLLPKLYATSITSIPLTLQLLAAHVAAMLLQLSAAQTQISTLQSLVQQLEQQTQRMEQERQDIADASTQQQASADSMRSVLQGEAVKAVLLRTQKQGTHLQQRVRRLLPALWRTAVAMRCEWCQ
jgi:ribosomal protein L29